MIALAAFVAPDSEGREQARALIGKDRMITVYVEASPKTCEARDPQGLYAAGGENIPGVSFPYDIPLDADLVINTEESSVAESVDRLLNYLRDRRIL